MDSDRDYGNALTVWTTNSLVAGLLLSIGHIFTIDDALLLIEALKAFHATLDAHRKDFEALAAGVGANVAGMIEMQPLTTRLRESLADYFYARDITSSALTERLNLERQEAADEIERLSARVLALEQERRGA